MNEIKLACAEDHLTTCARCRLEMIWTVLLRRKLLKSCSGEGAGGARTEYRWKEHESLELKLETKLDQKMAFSSLLMVVMEESRARGGKQFHK